MIKQSLFSVALAVATATLAAQAPKPKTAATKPTAPAAKPTPAQPTAGGYVPAIMQQRMTTLTGCLQHTQDYTLTNATVAQQGDAPGGAATGPKVAAAPAAAARPAAAAPAPAAPAAAAPAAAAYKLEGISPARLSLLIGKRVQVTGAFQDQGKTTTAKSLPRFEATAVLEATGTGSGSCS
jgi:hypothetical protein